MLTVELDLARINEAQERYLCYGIRVGAHFANQVRILRDTFDHAARRFDERQRAAAAKGAPLLEDGLPQTLEDQLFGPLASQGWPRRGAAILHGLQLPPLRPLLPALPCCPGGPVLSDLDGESYVTRLDDGPPQERSLGDTTAVVIYLAPLRQMRILWIGDETDSQHAIFDLGKETGGWKDWRPVSEAYADWLDQACRAKGSGAGAGRP